MYPRTLWIKKLGPSIFSILGAPLKHRMVYFDMYLTGFIKAGGDELLNRLDSSPEELGGHC